MTNSEARKINARRRIKRILIDIDASLEAKNKGRVYEMISIKDLITKKLKQCT